MIHTYNFKILFYYEKNAVIDKTVKGKNMLSCKETQSRIFVGKTTVMNHENSYLYC